MRKKIFLNLVICALVTAIFMCALVTGGMYIYSRNALRSDLVRQADTLSALLSAEDDPAAFLASGVYMERVTLVDADGTVLFDSRHTAGAMENHADRAEIDTALTSGEGWGVRDSTTIGETSIYYARRLPSGQVLRVSGSQKSVMSTVTGAVLWLLLGTFVCVLLAMLLARPVTRRLVAPINAIDLEHPLESDAYEELSPVLRRMEEQNKRIMGQIDYMSKQRNELNAILNGMREGLVILDEHHLVLAMNPSAQGILGAVGDPVGKTLLAVNRHETLVKLLHDKQGEGEMCSGGRILRVSISPVERGGMVLLFQDVTDARQAEESRRQFSANVSHELRTPLTTISGYAEMLSSGLANPADSDKLGTKILTESKRLLALIEDIIRLSRLDEGVSGEMKPVDLMALSTRCADKMSPLARRLNVTVTVSGSPVTIVGDPALLEEMLTNLIENGIKYNHEGGTVDVAIGVADGRPVVTVRDNGVGIAKEHQARVFERFYRVDKSRSKETGGTGLGLSIVKHGAQLHHADIGLVSTEGQGTSITLKFPHESTGCQET